MNERPIKTMAQICIDNSHSVGDVSDGKHALLYDEQSGCYYRVSLSHIIGAALKAVKEAESRLMDENRNAILKMRGEFDELRSEYNAFMADIKKANKIIIDLVEKGDRK